MLHTKIIKMFGGKSNFQNKFKFLHTNSFMNCQTLLNENQLELKAQVSKFCEAEIKPIADECDKVNHFSKDLWKKMGEFGLLGPTVPLEFGGLGGSYLDHIIIMEELSKSSGSIGLSYSAHSNLCVNQIVRWGNLEQKEKYLHKLIDGSFIGGLAMSEGGAGSDVVSMTTQATQINEDEFLLNGSKMWITNGPCADVFVVYAKTDISAKSKGITAFLIEKGMEGFQQGQKFDKLGMRGSDTGELIFDNCKVHKNQILGEINKGVKILMSGLDTERLVLSAGPLGLMQACMDIVVPYVNSRKQFDQFIGDFELVQGKLADMYSTLISHRSLLYSIATAYSQNEASRMDCASVILTCSEKATWMALQAIQLLGANGYMNEYPTGRYLRDAKLYEIGAGTSEIRRMLIGREINERYRKGM